MAAPATLNTVKRAKLIEDRPASGEMSIRANGMNRPRRTAVVPCRSKKPRVRASTVGLTRFECVSKKFPPRRPSTKATDVPSVVDVVATRKMTTTDSRPCAAKAAAVTSVVSVGKGTAIPSANRNRATIR